MSASPAIDGVAKVPSTPTYKTTSLAESMLLLAMLTVFQRGIGFVRGVLFCRWLPAEQLGLWDLVFGFLMLAGPLVVLGIPGSFGRYVEHYRQKGQLRTFLYRTTVATVVLSAIGCGLLWIFHEQAAVVLFKDASLAPIIPIVALTLISVVGFNYFVELFIAMRQMRMVSALQFVNSVLFAAIGLGLLLWYDTSAESVILSYGIACSVTLLMGSVVLARDWKQVPLCDRVPMQSEFWKKLLPFAAWLWAINLLSNLFEVVDRYMIVHFSGLTAEESITLVGDYHSSRVVPWLMVAVANLFGGILLPHLSADWERGEHSKVSKQLNLLLKASSMVMMAGAIVIGLTAPLLFNYVFEGKYSGGLEVLPWTLTYCVWYSLVGCAMLYFCCAEKTHVGAVVFGIGLAANVGLNALLLPMWGLTGAVVATALANAIAIVLALYLAHRHGMEIQKSTLLLAAAPFLLGLGWQIALAVWIVLLWQAYAGSLVFDTQEKQTLQEGLGVLTSKFRSRSQRTTRNMMRRRINLPLDGRGPLRVMYLVTSMPVGGAEILLVNLIRRMDRNRFAPELCCMKELGPLGEEMQKEVPTFHNMLSGKYDLRVVPRLTELFAMREIDAVVTVGAGDKMFWGRLCAWLAGVPVVASAIHSTGWPDSINWLNRRLTSITDRFIGVAAPHGKHLVEVEGFPQQKVTVIPNGIDTDRFVANGETRQRIRSAWGVSDDTAVCGIVAALRPEKDHALFLKAAARVVKQSPKSHFVIVGDGPERPGIESLRDELGIQDHVTMTGSRSDIPELLSAMDCFALTSKNEASPVSILEAMSTQLPVVAPRVGSIPDAVDEGVNGLLVEASNLDETADAMLMLMQNADRRAEMGKAAREKVLRYGSLDAMVSGYQDLISGVYRQKVQAALHAARQPASSHVLVPQRSDAKAS